MDRAWKTIEPNQGMDLALGKEMIGNQKGSRWWATRARGKQVKTEEGVKESKEQSGNEPRDGQERQVIRAEDCLLIVP